MKFIIFSFILLGFISGGLSKPLDDFNRNENQFDNLINDVDANLKTVEDWLYYGYRDQEAQQVRENRNLLTGEVRENFKRALEFSEQYEMYATPNQNSFVELAHFKSNNLKDSFVWNLNARDFMLFAVDEVSFYLKKVKIGLTKFNKTIEAQMAGEFVNTLNNVKSVIEQSDDFLELYMPSSYKEMDRKRIRVEIVSVYKWFGELISTLVKSLEPIEKKLRDQKNLAEADEVKSVLNSLNGDTSSQGFEVIYNMYLFTKYWNVEPKQNQSQSLKLKDDYANIMLTLIRTEGRILKKCHKGLTKDKQESDAEYILQLVKVYSEEILPVFEAAFWYRSRY